MKGRIVMKGDDPNKWEHYIDGVRVTRAVYKKAFPDKPLAASIGGHLSKCWPMVSDGLAVDPTQRDEAVADAKAKGVPTEFNAEGQAILTDRGHRKRYMKAYGFHDRNGGYGD